MGKRKKPPKCCKPDCFICPYADCIYDEMDTEDYTETNNRDYELHKDSTGRTYHKGKDEEYERARNRAKSREYYQLHKEEKRAYAREYYQTHKDEKKAYDAKYYQEHALEKKAYNTEYSKTHDRRKYWKEYYVEHRNEISEKRKKAYNAEASRKYYQANKEKKREYDRQRYLRRKEAGELGKSKKAV